MVKKTTKSVSILVVALFLLAATSLRSSAQTVKSQIQRMSGWQSCVACAGINAAGPGASIYTANTSSPSLSGLSRVFSLASGSPYADALWWKQLGAANGATNLRYDLDFDAIGAAIVAKSTEIMPMPTGVLQHAVQTAVAK